jgi:ABC-type uncharacterized transport system permease subunit
VKIDMMIEINFLALSAATLRMATPIAFAGLGGLMSERVGVMNIALEGMMMMGTLCSAYISYVSGNPWIALIVTALVGAVLGGLHAVLCIRFRGLQIVSGFGINIFTFGFTPFVSAIVWGSRGTSERVVGLPTLTYLGLKETPIIDEILGSQSPLMILLIFAVILIHIALYKTSFGLRIRAIGANPKAALSSGIHIRKYQYTCVILSGIFASLGGAFLVLSVANHYSTGMTAGRGFIGLVAMILGKWKPINVFGASILLGFGDALQISLQGSGIPVQMIQTIPYLLTIFVLIGIVGKIVAPTDYKPHAED